MSTGDDKIRDEHLLDGCLDEVLGGRTPPDLTARIMQAWAMRRQAGVDQNLLLPPLPGPAIETLPLEIAPQSAVRPRWSVPLVRRRLSRPRRQRFCPGPSVDFVGVTRSRSRKPNLWPWLAAAACVAGLGITIALVTNSQPGPGPVVGEAESKPDIVKSE